MKKTYAVIIVLALLIVPFLFSTSQAFPPKKGDKACITCHKLDKKEAEVIVKKAVPAGTVTDIQMSPIKGVWQIGVDAGEGKHGLLYLDFSKKFLVAQIVPIEVLDKAPPPSSVDVSKIPLHDALVLGSSTAKNKVIVFTDPDCPYCRELHKLMKQITEKRSDISFSLLLFPLPMHKDSPKKVQAILCSKSLEMLDDAFAGKTIPEPACSAEVMERNKALAKSLGFTGTPTLVRNDGAVHAGILPEDKLLDWIDKKQ